ncbi:MAG: histidine phosphatase family protein [Rhizobacter sp.]|nr:histidine phosphatase family protein [Rhizobacter sp.]
MSTALSIFIVRHGETLWSLSGQHTGHTDLELTPNGREQARRLMPALAHTPFTQVLTSPMRRARETCELAGLGAHAQADADLGEWDYGAYEGRRSVDIRAERAGWDIWRDGCPGGETPAQVAARADRVVARLMTMAGAVLLFSHGQFCRVLAARWVGLGADGGRYFALDPATISVLGFEGHDVTRPVLSSWNAVPAAPGSFAASRTVP